MSLKAQVLKMVKTDVELRGIEWLLSLGYGPCNDYAAITTARLSAETGRHIRFESVARYIRDYKEYQRSLQPK